MTISDVVSRVYFLTGTNVNSFPAADMLISINTAYNRVASLIDKNDARWQWDDLNNTDLPIATTSLVSGQQDYSLATSHLTIDRIEIKDSAGNWTELSQIDQQMLKGGRKTALLAYRNVTGLPLEYDVVGASVFLYPIPNYSLASSLKIYFTRGPAEFTSAEVTAGTKSPGFNSLFHDLIPLWVAYDYLVVKIPQLATSVMNAILLKEKSIEEFYGQRDRDTRARMTTSYAGAMGNASGQILGTASDSNK